MKLSASVNQKVLLREERGGKRDGGVNKWACEWAPKTVLLGKSGRHIKGISKSSFSPREKKAKAIILQLPSFCLPLGRRGDPGEGAWGKALGEDDACRDILEWLVPRGHGWNYKVCYREKKSEEQI